MKSSASVPKSRQPFTAVVLKSALFRTNESDFGICGGFFVRSVLSTSMLSSNEIDEPKAARGGEDEERFLRANLERLSFRRHWPIRAHICVCKRGYELGAVRERIEEERRGRKELHVCCCAEPVELVHPQRKLLHAKRVAGAQIGDRDPTRRGHDIGLAQIQRSTVERSPAGGQPGFATNGDRADSFCGSWIRDVNRRSGQSPEARRQFRFAAEGMERRLIVRDRK